MKIPPLETRKLMAFWRMNLFANSWHDPEEEDDYYKREWLAAKTRALVDADRLFMPDGYGALARTIKPTITSQPQSTLMPLHLLEDQEDLQK